MAANARAKVRRWALAVLAIVALCVYAFDQITKLLVVENLEPGVQVQVLGELLKFQLVKNSGAAFSLASGSTWFFSVIATLVTIFIIWFARRIRSMGWAFMFGLLLGGVLGNLTDRLLREPGFGIGHVVDFLQIPLLPAIFNIADSAIVASMGLFIILTIRGVSLDGTRTTNHVPSTIDADTGNESMAGGHTVPTGELREQAAFHPAASEQAASEQAASEHAASEQAASEQDAEKDIPAPPTSKQPDASQ